MSDLDSNAGKVIPLEFVENLADAALRTVTDYLKANNAPQQVVDLIDQSVLLARFEELKRINHSEKINGSLFGMLPYTLANITALGGDLSTGEYKIDAIPWSAK